MVTGFRGAVLAGVIAAVFATSFLAEPFRGGGWFWDLGNALGLLAFAGLLFQMIPVPRKRSVRRHEVLGYWVLGTAILHAFWFLAGDGTVRFYLLPGGPAHMWLGLAGLIALAVLSVLARMPDRLRVHRHYRQFRKAHRILGFVTVGAAALHVVLSGFYLPAWWQAGVLAGVLVACVSGRRYWARLAHAPAASVSGYLIFGAMACVLFLLIRDGTP